MKLVILSDSHGQKEPLRYIREKHGDADLVIHCGDICLPKEYSEGWIQVAGNCDDPSRYPLADLIELEGHRILITHGHAFFSGRHVNHDALARFALRNECDILCFGHSHMYCDVIHNGVRLLNPGSIVSNRDMTPPSFMIVDLKEDSVSVQRKEYRPLF